MTWPSRPGQQLSILGLDKQPNQGLLGMHGRRAWWIPTAIHGDTFTQIKRVYVDVVPPRWHHFVVGDYYSFVFSLSKAK